MPKPNPLEEGEQRVTVDLADNLEPLVFTELSQFAAWAERNPDAEVVRATYECAEDSGDPYIDRSSDVMAFLEDDGTLTVITVRSTTAPSAAAADVSRSLHRAYTNHEERRGRMTGSSDDRVEPFPQSAEELNRDKATRVEEGIPELDDDLQGRREQW